MRQRNRIRNQPARNQWLMRYLFFTGLLFFFSSALQAQVKASFTVDTTQGCSPLPIHCTSTAQGDVVNWYWITSDGQTSTEENPSFLFTHPGRFRIWMKVSNYTIADSAYRDIVANGVPTSFTYQYNNICTSPVPVQFHVYDTTIIGNYHWDFGDSTVSIEVNPSHTYTSQGNYQVHLVTYSKEGCVDSLVKTIQTGQVTVDFNAPASVCSNSKVVFTSASSSLPKSAVWTVNGTVISQSAAGFTYVFTTPGIYSVMLTEDFGGCTFSKEKSITVLQKPRAAFSETGSLQSCLYPSLIQYENTSQFADSYNWNFGDSSTSVDVNPSHNYFSAGQFSPILIAAGANGCADTLVKRNLILLGPPIVSRLQGLPSSHCLPDTLITRPVMASPEAIAVYDWNWGDGNHSYDSVPTYIYTKQGNYNVSLILKTVSGCTDTFIVNRAISVGDSVVPDFTVDKDIACSSDSFHFTGTASKPGGYQWIWSFGDNTPYSNSQNPAHQYRSTGYKTVFLQINNNGCYIRTTKKDIVMINPPVAGIHVTYDCKNQLNVSFTDTCQQALSWLWNWGDGSPSSSQQSPPIHVYPSSGIYTVKLTTANGACTSTDTVLVPILNTKPIFTFEPANTLLCRKQGIWMSATNPEYIADYYWNFDDGRSAFSDTSIYNFYSAPGTYHPSLVAKYKNGCYDTVYSPKPVVINGPTASFATAAGSTCLHQETVFTDKSITDGTHSIVSWWWNCGDSYSLKNTTPAFTHIYAKSGSYRASLLITDGNNCTDTAYYTVKINNLPLVSAGRDTFVCEGNSVTLSAGGAGDYVWNADATLNCSPCAAPEASPQVATHSYVVKGTDANNCSATDTIQVEVTRPFNMSVSSDVSEICEGTYSKLSASGTDDYTWQPPAGLDDAKSASPLASPGATTTYTVTGTDKHHCFSQVGSLILNVYPNPVFSIHDSVLLVQKGDMNVIATTGTTDIESWQWSPSVGLSCNNCPQPVSTAIKTVTYNAVVTNNYGCTATDKITIHVLCNQNKIYIPSGFTPNGDGKNDKWYVMSSVDNLIRSFSIYGRNGEKVFSRTNSITNNATEGWNGMYNGIPVSSGVYVYRIEVMCNDAVIPFTGTVTLLR